MKRNRNLSVLLLSAFLMSASCSKEPATKSGGLINGYDINLETVAVSSGTLSPSFSQRTTGYNVDLAESVTAVTVKPSAADRSSRVTVNGEPVEGGDSSRPIPVAEGKTALADIVVTAPDGVTAKKYSILFYRSGP